MERDFEDVLRSLKHSFYDDFDENMAIITKLNSKGILQESASEEDMIMLDTLMHYEGNGSIVQLLNKLAELMGNAGFGIEHLCHAFPYVDSDDAVEYVFINKDLKVEIIKGYSKSYERLCKLAYDSFLEMVKI